MGVGSCVHTHIDCEPNLNSYTQFFTKNEDGDGDDDEYADDGFDDSFDDDEDENANDSDSDDLYNF